MGHIGRKAAAANPHHRRIKNILKDESVPAKACAEKENLEPNK